MKCLSRSTRLAMPVCLGMMALAGCIMTDGSPQPTGQPMDASPQEVAPPVVETRSPDDYGRPSSVEQPQPGVPVNIAGDPDRKDVPVDARLVCEGKGTLTYTAPRDGLIFVVDADTDTLEYRGQINRNEAFKLSPDGNNATINGKKVLNVDLKKKDKHKIFFLRD